MVNPPGSNASGLGALQSAGAFFHHMPVDQAFTLEAGPDDLGLPEGDGRLHRPRWRVSSVSTSASTANWRSSMEFRPGLPMPSSIHLRQAGAFHVLVSRRLLRETPGRDIVLGVRYRPAVCGYDSAIIPMRKNSPRWACPKRALVSSSAANVEMSFGDAARRYRTRSEPASTTTVPRPPRCRSDRRRFLRRRRSRAALQVDAREPAGVP